MSNQSSKSAFQEWEEHQTKAAAIIQKLQTEFGNAYLGAAKIYNKLPVDARMGAFNTPEMIQAMKDFGHTYRGEDNASGKIRKPRNPIGTGKSSPCNPEEQAKILALLPTGSSGNAILTHDVGAKLEPQMNDVTIGKKLLWLKETGKADFKKAGKTGAGKGWFKTAAK